MISIEIINNKIKFLRNVYDDTINFEIITNENSDDELNSIN